MAQKDPYVYAVIRVDVKTYQNINQELKKYGYHDIKAIIPTVDVLTKSLKCKNEYTTWPLLFNYGFLKIRKSRLYDRDLVIKLRKQIQGIYSFMKSLETLHPRKIKARIDNADDFDDFSQVALIPRDEVRRLLKISKQNCIHSADDITTLPIGSMVVLRGYPYEGINAKVLDISTATRMAKIQLCHDIAVLTIDVSFDHVFYTVYTDSDADYVPTESHAEQLGTIYSE